MDKIDEHPSSKARLYFSKDRFLTYPNDKQGQADIGNVTVYDNFIFSATICPVSHVTLHGTGRIIFKDARDGYIYRMTQRSLLSLLNGLLDGRVEMRDCGFCALYTFRPIGWDVTIDVFKGHK